MRLGQRDAYLEETVAIVIRIVFEVDAFSITVGEGRVCALAIATRLGGSRESTSSPAVDAVSVGVGLETAFSVGECAGLVEGAAPIDVAGSESVVAALEGSGAGIYMVYEPKSTLEFGTETCGKEFKYLP